MAGFDLGEVRLNDRLGLHIAAIGNVDLTHAIEIFTYDLSQILTPPHCPIQNTGHGLRARSEIVGGKNASVGPIKRKRDSPRSVSTIRERHVQVDCFPSAAKVAG